MTWGDHEQDVPTRLRYNVLVEDEDGIRSNVIVPAAYGPNDARNQVLTDYPSFTILGMTEQWDGERADLKGRG